MLLDIIIEQARKDMSKNLEEFLDEKVTPLSRRQEAVVKKALSAIADEFCMEKRETALKTEKGKIICAVSGYVEDVLEEYDVEMNIRSASVHDMLNNAIFWVAYDGKPDDTNMYVLGELGTLYVSYFYND